MRHEHHPGAPARRPAGAVRRFAREEDGSMVVFGLFVALITFMTLGLAVDAMHAEYRRAKLQGTCDRAALAAADLDQPYVPAEVVQSYFDAAGMGDTLAGEPVVEETLNSRTVRASAAEDARTSFLHMVGVDTFALGADCAANETIPDVEVSLVLDVSSSMTSYDRLENMQDAAAAFVESVLPEDGAPISNDGGIVSVSLVPYSMSVNVTPAIRDWYDVDRIHDYSSCVMFPDAAFATTAIDPDETLRQYAHFDHKDGKYSGSDPARVARPLCPRTSSTDDGASPMVPFQTERAPLLDAIDDLEVVGATGIAAGMKWGLALLDPAAQGLAAHLQSLGRAEAEVAGRPYAFDRERTRKVAVLMTDGDPDGERDVFPVLRSDALSNVWYDPIGDRYSVLLRGRHLADFPYDQVDDEKKWDEESKADDDDVCAGPWAAVGVDSSDSDAMDDFAADGIRRVAADDQDDTCHPVWYWVEEKDRHHEWKGSKRGAFEGHPYSQHRDDPDARNDWDLLGASLVRLTWIEVLDRFTAHDFREFIWLHPRKRGYVQNAEWNIYSDVRDDTRDRPQSIARLLELCTVAKSQGIDIYTVAFEMDRISKPSRRELARELMEGCATADSYFFDVETNEIREAFSAIASQINQLRLIE